jgi:hypothetical protein
MKKSLLVWLVMATIACKATAQNNIDDAAVYFDKVVADLATVNEASLRFQTIVVHSTTTAAQLASEQANFIALLTAADARVTALPAFNGSQTFRNAMALSYRSRAKVIRDGSEVLATLHPHYLESVRALRAYYTASDSMMARLQVVFDKAFAAQKTFAAANDMRVGIAPNNTALLKKEARISASSIYIREIEVIKFGVYIQTDSLLKAINAADTTRLRLQTRHLLEVCAEGKKALTQLGAWEGDNALKNKAIGYCERHALFVTDNIAVLQSYMRTPLANRDNSKTERYNVAIRKFNAMVTAAYSDYQAAQLAFEAKHLPPVP